MHHDVWSKWNEASKNIGGGNRGCAVARPLRLRFFESKLEAHHEVHPRHRVAFEGVQHRSAFLLAYSIGTEDVVNLLLLIVDALHDLPLLPLALAGVVLRVTLGRQIAAKSHGDRAGGDLRQSSQDNQFGHAHGAGKSSSQRKWDSETVSHPDDDVAHQVAGGKMPFLMQNICMLMRHASKTSRIKRRCRVPGTEPAR